MHREFIDSCSTPVATAPLTLKRACVQMMFIKSQPERTQDRCECHSRLADIDLRLEAPDAALEACQEGMEAVKAGPMRS